MPGAHPTNEDLNGFKRGEHVEGPHICEQYVFQAPGQTSGVWGWNDTQALYCAACGRLASDHVVLAKPTFEEIKKKPPPSLPSGYVQLRLGHRLGRREGALTPRCGARPGARLVAAPLHSRVPGRARRLGQDRTRHARRDRRPARRRCADSTLAAQARGRLRDTSETLPSREERERGPRDTSETPPRARSGTCLNPSQPAPPHRPLTARSPPPLSSLPLPVSSLPPAAPPLQRRGARPGAARHRQRRWRRRRWRARWRAASECRARSRPPSPPTGLTPHRIRHSGGMARRTPSRPAAAPSRTRGSGKRRLLARGERRGVDRREEPRVGCCSRDGSMVGLVLTGDMSHLESRLLRCSPARRRTTTPSRTRWRGWCESLSPRSDARSRSLDAEPSFATPYLPTSPHISPHLPTSPHISPRLPTSPIGARARA